MKDEIPNPVEATLLSTLFSNQKVFFQKQYTASAIRSKMTLVTVGPQVVPNPKTHVSGLGNFLGRSNGLPAPCGK